MPETLLLKIRQRIGEKSKIARDKSFEAEDDLRERGENEQCEKNSKAHGRENFLGESGLAIKLHAQIKTGGDAKCNCAQLTLSS